MSDIKHTPLTDVHKALGAKMVDFAGYLMPVAYGSIIEEHNAVRSNVGIFDVSHMGEFLVTGPGARKFVNEIVTNDVGRMEPGALLYTVMCTERGTVVDDLLVFLMSNERILLVVNASNIDKDFQHVNSFDKRDVRVENISDSIALLAVQGPRARDVLKACPLFLPAARALDDTEYYHGFSFTHEESEVIVTRTGYTGELGYEVFVPPGLAKIFWEKMSRAGETFGLRPIGLGARDTLRFEASYCLYGHEIDEATSPLEAGLAWVVKLKKDSFRGLKALREEKSRGPKRKLVGFELEGRAIARQGYPALHGGVQVGSVTSGAFAPTLQKSLCMALIETSSAETPGPFAVEIRGKSVPASPVPLPFYKSRVK